ncbi:MAG: leucyl/phenylalanyl-tRNA--protein transferase [Herpetosiphon sp.]|nr:leucyl/phenylalanyl-tRNA--protein transferase [Herpetosiphon sp.]
MKLTPEMLLYGYSQGVFPMDHEGKIYWYDPDPRAIIPLDERFHVSHSLARTIRKGVFEIRIDTAFEETMRRCAEAAHDRPTTWISDEFIRQYVTLHEAGFAHSVEAWHNGAMVGGLYGVALAGLFAGESMWTRVRDASKVALVALVERLRAGGFVLLDTQFITPHLARFGTYEISRRDYHRRLQAALKVQAEF